MSGSNEVYTYSAPFSHDLLLPLGSDEYCLWRQIKIIITSGEIFCAGQIVASIWKEAGNRPMEMAFWILDLWHQSWGATLGVSPSGVSIIMDSFFSFLGKVFPDFVC